LKDGKVPQCVVNNNNNNNERNFGGRNGFYDGRPLNMFQTKEKDPIHMKMELFKGL
jgi:hypothetical protein